MFRYTATFLVIFMVLNHDFAASRSIDFPFGQRNELTRKKGEVAETGLAEVPNSRQKRSAGSLFRTGAQLGSSGAFALSVGTTVYHAIRKCKDYRPKPCKNPTCHYYTCPDVCKNPEDNREYVEDERKALKTKLESMDNIQRDAFNLATQAINAGINNKRILAEIDRINQKVDELIFSIAQLDINLSTKLRNNSVAIGTMIRNQLLSLDEIVSSPEIEGIFDKWTWEGTGVFVLSLALPISLKVFSYFKQRYAINQIYKDLKSDFAARFVNQKASSLNPDARIKNKFAYVQGLSSQQIDKQLKANAKSVFFADRANQQISKVEKFVNNWITPAVNLIVIALSVWATYSQINNCQLMTNDMQDTAIKMAQKADEIEWLKRSQVDPLLSNVTTQAWPQVKAMMTNQTTLDWLDGIRNLTLGAHGANITTAAVIQDFIDNIATASYSNFLDLQHQLIFALKTIDYEYTCLADKQHAVTTVITDCRIGRLSFPDLYAYATSKHKLNREACVAKGIMPYTTQEQFWVILNATAYHQNFYNNCLLNDDNLRDKVCDANIQGYKTPAAIIAHVNETGLTEEMVPNFLGRCPPPKITPKKRGDACDLYCLYQSVESIAKKVILLQDQVLGIIPTCPICSVDTADLKKICKLHYCDLDNATTIEKEVKKPLPTINYIIANNCSNKCIIDDADTKKLICDDYKCKGKTAAKIAKSLALPESSVSEVFPECSKYVSTCVIGAIERGQIMSGRCFWMATAASMVAFGLVSRPVQVVQNIIDSQTCDDFKANGVPGSWTFTP